MGIDVGQLLGRNSSPAVRGARIAATGSQVIVLGPFSGPAECFAGLQVGVHPGGVGTIVFDVYAHSDRPSAALGSSGVGRPLLTAPAVGGYAPAKPAVEQSNWYFPFLFIPSQFESYLSVTITQGTADSGGYVGLVPLLSPFLFDVPLRR